MQIVTAVAATHNHLPHAKERKMLRYLTLKNKVDELNTLSVWINDDIATLFKISEKTVFKIDLILTELIANIISYAYPTQCESKIEIKCHYYQDNIEIEIEDSGIPFNPLAAPDVVLPKTLAEADIGGLGIHLVRHYIDEGNYQRKNDKNIFSMRLKP
jgi:anti-sigma regulatory factor (Ser/Thr protein kinase)